MRIIRAHERRESASITKVNLEISSAPPFWIFMTCYGSRYCLEASKQ